MSDTKNNTNPREVPQEVCAAHTPTPYHVEKGQDAYYIVRRWDVHVRPVDHPTFGSGFGAHVADIPYHSKNGVATPAQAKANADFIVHAANSFDSFLAYITAQAAIGDEEAKALIRSTWEGK